MPTVAAYSFDAFVVSACFIDEVPAFALGDGSVRLIAGGETSVQAHKGSVLVTEKARDGKSLVTGGDDGKVVRITKDGTSETLAERPRKWIDILACGPDGAVAFASGRIAWTRDGKSAEKEFTIERAIGGLAFAPKGMRLAVSRYDGATLFWVNTTGTPVELTWKGAHQGITWSPDGKYVVTSMQENALHGWRLSDSQDMRMTGYPGKIKSISWSAKGRYLATSGATAAIAWPFFGKTGPMGQNPLQLGTRGDQLVTCVACHPTEDMAAVGYSDGMIMACRFEDGAEVLLRRPGNGPVSALGWDNKGLRITFGSEEGEAGVIDISG